MHISKHLLLLSVILVLGLILAACAETAVPEVQPEIEATPCPTAVPPEPCPEAEACPPPPECPAGADVPFEDAWLLSGHADAEAEAFVHWNEDDPAEVPASCAKCHSTPGYRDFVGADGTAAGVVDGPAEIGTTITCIACHNDATQALTSVTFPSGLEIMGLGDEARCMQCHQGRASTATVDASIEEAGLSDMDTVSADLGFTNIHYYAAAATQYGTWAMGGYEYAGQAYDVKFAHVSGMDTCVDCHDPHTLEIQVGTCAECHEGVTTVEDLRDVRTNGSLMDYDGDGNIEEGIYYELEGLRTMLYEAIRRYAGEVAGSPIVYDAGTHPYFFIDTNENGEVDEGEASRDNSYASWTGRLAKAAYNFQTALKDPGAFAHGGKYMIELMYDSIADLNTALPEPVSLANAHRIDAGHFASSEEVFRHWDEEGAVEASCVRCHSDVGLPMYLENGTTVSVPPSSGFRCVTCHDPETFEPYAVETVAFPSGAVLDTGKTTANICLNCHQGRESGASVDAAVAGMNEDTVIEGARFINAHYFAAGATLFGADAAGAYQYAGEDYVGRLEHVQGMDTCVECHEPHALTVNVRSCEACHDTEDVRDIRMIGTDFDGDGTTEEGLADEISTLHDAVYAAMQDYAARVLSAPVVYDGHTYPYFFNDTNGNGEADADEVNYGNAFNSWSPRLLKAAYNYQYVAKDPGAFAHNGLYIVQVLYDTLADLSEVVPVDMSAMIRPTASD